MILHVPSVGELDMKVNPFLCFFINSKTLNIVHLIGFSLLQSLFFYPSHFFNFRWNVCVESANTGKETFTMNNYLSLGIDAQIAHSFHNLRAENPSLCASRWVNKLWYGTYGFLAMFQPNVEFGEVLNLIVDGKETKLPPEAQGIMLLNVNHYAGGADMWGEMKEEGFKKPEIDDKRIELAAITGSFHMGSITFNLTNATRLAQGREIEIQVKGKHYLQVDGEPKEVESPHIVVSHATQSMMLKRLDS